MLYSQAFQLPSSGVYRLGTIGGSAVTKEGPNGLEFQVGYERPPRLGILNIVGTDDSPDVSNCIANVSGYYNNEINGCAVPSRIRVELPCSVEIIGPAGTPLLVEAWEVFAHATRGARQSFTVEGAGNITEQVPPWADSYDVFRFITTADTLTFFDSAGNILGILSGNTHMTPFIGCSLPSGARTFNLTSSAAGRHIVFRQGF